MINTVEIKEIKLTDNGFVINNKSINDYVVDQELVLNNLSFFYTQNNFNFETVLSKINVQKRVIIEINNIEKADEIIKNIRLKTKIFAAYGFANFKFTKYNNEVQKCEDISFIENQETVNNYNNDLLNLWNKEYYDDLSNHVSVKYRDIFRQQYIDLQKQHKRFLAMKNNMPIAELGYIDTNHPFLNDKIRALSIISDSKLTKIERKYIWKNLFNYLENKNILFAAILDHNKPSIGLVSKNGFELKYIQIVPAGE